jgi:hypothetical protein
MSRCSRLSTFATLSMLWCGASVSAETLRCQSVNGNLNCAGSGGVSCQTVDGRKVCVSGHGDVVQTFGGGRSSRDDAADRDIGNDGSADDEGMDGGPSDPTLHERLERHDAHGHVLLLQRDGTRLHLRTDWLAIDRE